MKELEIPSETSQDGVPLPWQVDSKAFSVAAKVTLHRYVCAQEHLVSLFLTPPVNTIFFMKTDYLNAKV